MHVQLHQNKFISPEGYTSGFECDGPKCYPFVVVDYAVILLIIVLSVLEISVISSEGIFNQHFGKKQVKSVLCLIANAP